MVTNRDVEIAIRPIWAICRNTLSVWLRNRALIAASLLPPVAFLAAGFLAAASVSHSWVALVNLDQGYQGERLAQAIHQSDVFRVIDANQAQADTLIHGLKVAAVITIPADFTDNFYKHVRTPVTFEVNNLNLDFTNDIRRSVPTAITQFYKTQGAMDPIQVSMQEQDLRRQDIQLYQYEVVPILLLMVLIAGLVNTAVSTAREYESRTIKEILVAPVSDVQIALGIVLAGLIIGVGSGLLVAFICILFKWLSLPAWNYSLIALMVLFFTALLASTTGLMVGVGLKRIQAAHAFSTNTALPLFFLAGGVGVLAFEPQWLQTIAAFVPLSYANHALQMAVFYSSSDQLARDLAVLLGVNLAAAMFALMLLKKSRSRVM